MAPSTFDTSSVQALEARMLSTLQAQQAAMEQDYRSLHAIPELAFQEHETSAYLSDVLRSMGLSPTPTAGTGLVLSLPHAGDGPTVLLRADMDGLPIQEHGSNDPISTHQGCMHACGHDGHMAALLGLARAVTAMGAGELLPGRIVLLFQPAEEQVSGASRIVDEGVLDRLHVDCVLGLHLWSGLPEGHLVIPDTSVMGSTDRFEIILRGKGGHGAMPQQAKDAILGAAHLVVALQSLVSREVDPLCPGVVTVGRLEAGSAHNIIAHRAELFGTIRAADPATRHLLLRRVEEMSNALATGFGLEAQVTMGGGNPPLINHPAVARLLRAAARCAGIPGPAEHGPVTLGAEDFAIYLEHRPGAFMLLGMGDADSATDTPHHNPRFRLLPRILPVAAELLLRGAIRLMTDRSWRPLGS